MLTLLNKTKMDGLGASIWWCACWDEHIDDAGHVRLVRGEGILHRPGHGGDGRLVEDAVRAREGLHQEVEVGDASLDERHPGMVEEVFDVFPAWHGREVVDDDHVVVL